MPTLSAPLNLIVVTHLPVFFPSRRGCASARSRAGTGRGRLHVGLPVHSRGAGQLQWRRVVARLGSLKYLYFDAAEFVPNYAIDDYRT
jgi:hypothetical protein